jgi:hypothetical protein
MSAGTLAPYAFPQAFDDDGHPLDGGLLYTYLAGTSTPTATFTDGELTVPHANPIALTAGGRYKIYLDAFSYKFVLKSYAGIVIDTTDPVNSVGLVTSGVLTEFSFFGDSTSPITSTTYPSGSGFDSCHAGTAILALNAANLSAGTYVLQGMVSNIAGVATTVSIVNLTDGAPDTPLASMSGSSTVGSPVASAPVTFAPPGAVKQYGIKVKVTSGAGFAWAIQLVKQ